MVNKSSQSLYNFSSLAAIFTDLLLIAFSFLIVIAFSPVSVSVLFRQYFDFVPYYAVGWLLASFFYKRYVGKISANYLTNILRLLWSVLTVQALIIVLSFIPLVSISSLKMVSAFNSAVFFKLIFYIIHYSKSATEYKDFVEIKKDEPEEEKL